MQCVLGQIALHDHISKLLNNDLDPRVTHYAERAIIYNSRIRYRERTRMLETYQESSKIEVDSMGLPL